MIDFRSVFFLIGILLSGIAATMLIPLFVELFIYKTDEWQGFAAAIFICGFVGSALALANRPQGKIVLGMREAFLMTSLSWIASSVFAGLPFYCSDLGFSFVNSCFESVSALTTTGGTIMVNLDTSPKGILLWRALLQWLGGTGIIVMAMTILPTLRIGGMQLFRSEFSDRSEKILPRVSQIASAILVTYVVFTLVCAFLLYFAGMSTFDAICYAMATISTGGLSTHDSSISFFNSPLIEMILIVFMIIGGSTLILYVKLWHGDTKSIQRDSQLRTYLGVIFIVSCVVTAWSYGINENHFIPSLRHSIFTVVSVITSTGFTSSDYNLLGNFPRMLLFILSVVGGCTGSTTGGIKIFRFQVLFALALAHLRQLRRPHGIYLPTYQRQKISESIATSVFTFITLYCLCLVILACGLASFGLDFSTSLSGAAATLGNVGLGLENGAANLSNSYASLSDGPKIIMMFGMILGRLELLTILVLLIPSFWRD
jgi:trk system potassium uptake protein TrkH